MIHYKTPAEIEIMRESCLLVGKTHAQIVKILRPGITTMQINKLAEEFIRDNKGKPTFLNFNGFPYATCISVNDAVVHGFPDNNELKDGDYLRINNLTLGYTLPKIIQKIDKVRVYFTAINPFIFTNYSGFSPEVAGNDNGNPLTGAGIELDAYPTNKTILFGVNLSF